MRTADEEVLARAIDWLGDGHAVVLATVAHTWGSSPRPPGAWLAVRDDGRPAGSVSGGCIDDDLCARIARGERPERPTTVRYGGSPEACERFQLPCGGTVELVLETLDDARSLQRILNALRSRKLSRRRVSLVDGSARVLPATEGPEFSYDGKVLDKLCGPTWRLLLIGAGQVSRFAAEMALALDYEVLVCDPREEYASAWNVPGSILLRDMPDDCVSAHAGDSRSAVLALSHDPKLDDLALLDALPSKAFYVGALGSRANNERRRERLATLGLDGSAIARLHGPVGLPLGGHTPGEIALAALAGITQVRRQMPSRREDTARHAQVHA